MANENTACVRISNKHHKIIKLLAVEKEITITECLERAIEFYNEFAKTNSDS